MQRKTLSVIVPVYNVENYLPRCLDSLLAQTRLPDEIICVDDGSTDRGGRILDEYAKKNSVIKVLHKENGGLVSARKAGLSSAIGEYATYVDSDDWIEPEMYADMMRAVEEKGSQIVTSGIIHDYGDHITEETERAKLGLYDGARLSELKSNLVDTSRFFSRNILFSLVNKIIETGLLKEHQFAIDSSITVGEDICVSFPAIINSNSCYVTGKSYYHYCSRADSIMGGQTDEAKSSVRKMLKYLESILKDYQDQYNMIELYYKLMFMPEEVVSYRDGVFYPYGEIDSSSKVVLYGAGTFGQILYDYITKNTSINVVAWVDKSVKDERIITPDELKDITHDLVLVTILIADVVGQVVGQLVEMGISKDRILCINKV